MTLDTATLAEPPISTASQQVAWQNPAPASLYRLLVWGDGPAALAAAYEASCHGGQIALVASDLLAIGDLHASRVAHRELAHAARDPLATFDAAIAAIRTRQQSIRPMETAWRLTGYGVDVFVGPAVLTGPDSLEVAGQRLRFHRAVIAPRTHSVPPVIDGLADVGFITAETITTLASLPQRVAVLGNGPAACELAQAFRRFGSEVHIITGSLSLLPNEEPAAAALVHRRFEQEGIHLHLGWHVTQVERTGTAKGLVVERHGQRKKLLADEILVDVDTRPDVEGLGLAAAGVQHDSCDVYTDNRWCTTNPAIYALADDHPSAREIVANALFHARHRRSEIVVPRVIHADPQIAQVGLTAAAAHASGKPINTECRDLPDDGFMLIHTQPRTRRIVGATIVAANAADLIGQVAILMAHRLPLDSLRA